MADPERDGTGADGTGPGKRSTRARKAGAKRGRTGAGTGRKRRAASGADALLEHLRRDFAAVGEAVAGEIDRAYEAARRELRERGVDRASVERVRDGVRDSLAGARERLREAGRRVGSDDRMRDAADAGLTGLHAVASGVRGLAERVEQALAAARPRSAGETVEAGAYTCRSCGQTVVLSAPAALGPCAACAGTRYRA